MSPMNDCENKSSRGAERSLSFDTEIQRTVPAGQSELMKSVRFFITPEIMGNSPNPLTSKSIWYTSRELQAIRADIKSMLRLMKANGVDIVARDDSKYCLRGVEDIQRTGGTSEKRRRTRCIIQGILDEQNNQRNMGIYDPKGLQVQASACSKSARAKALQMGKNDEMEAMKIHFESSFTELCTLYSSTSTVDSSTAEDSKNGCLTIITAKISLHDQRKNTSSARTA